MKSLQEILIANIVKLRRDRQLTQSELGERINYSDKTISKWENGDSCPNIEAVYRLAQFYGVTVDDLLSDVFEVPEATLEEAQDAIAKSRQSRYRKIVIALLSVVTVWTIAVFVFMYEMLRGQPGSWLAFIDALPASCVVLLVFNSLWGKAKFNYIIISVLLWVFITSVFLHLLSYNLWMAYLLGIPIQIAVILWSQLKK